MSEECSEQVTGLGFSFPVTRRELAIFQLGVMIGGSDMGKNDTQHTLALIRVFRGWFASLGLELQEETHE